MDVFDMAKKRYGRTWSKEMLQALVKKLLLTEPQYEEIVGEPYVA